MQTNRAQQEGASKGPVVLQRELTTRIVVLKKPSKVVKMQRSLNAANGAIQDLWRVGDDGSAAPLLCPNAALKEQCRKWMEDARFGVKNERPPNRQRSDDELDFGGG